MTDFSRNLKDTKLYDLPVAAEVTNGVERLDLPVAAFEHAGNWYVTPKVEGRVPTDPKQWSLVVDNSYHPNKFFITLRALPKNWMKRITSC